MALVLIVEDGSGTLASNSYASIAEANAYHDGHLYASAWLAASDDRKAAALVMATRVLDAGMRWVGKKTIGDSSLGWPRYMAPDTDRRDFAIPWPRPDFTGPYWPTDVVPKPVKDGCAEMARILLGEDRTVEPESRGISKMSVGKGELQVDFDPSDRRVPVTDFAAGLMARCGQRRGKSVRMRQIVRQ